MRRPSIAVIGDTALVRGELTDAGAIAIELARLDQVDVGFRSVATSDSARQRFERHFGTSDVSTWLTARARDPHPDEDESDASLRMGDPIDIPAIFDHDVVVLACRDVRLRRFLADLPVHTRPDVRMLAVLHFEDGVPEGERVEDVLRFDAIIGSDRDFQRWGALSDLAIDPDTAVMSLLHRQMHGTNARALVSWDPDGGATLAEPLEEILTAAADSVPGTPGPATAAVFIATVALGMARRQPFPDIVSSASDAFARRCRDNEPPD